MKGTFHSKTVPPRIRGAIPRERLFAQLDSLSSRTVTWISSPAGSGKTTLVGTYLESRRLPALWYRVDETDHDVATFFYYMSEAGKKLRKGRKKPLPLFTPEFRLGIRAFTRRYFESLFRKMPFPSVLVFDNYQDVSGDSEFHEVITDGLRYVPEGIRILIVSRREAPSPFVSLKVDGQLSSLGWDEVRFTFDEVREMLRKKNLSEKALTQIWNQAQGWAAAIVLMMDEDLPAAPPSINQGALFSYFAVEIFRKLDARMKDFLLATALLPTISPGIAGELTGIGESASILSYLHRNHYFTGRHGSEYAYHPLFKEFLIEQGRKHYPPEHLTALKIQAAGLLARSHKTEEAVTLLLDEHAYPDALPLILSHARDLLTQGRGATLEEWAMRLPPGMRENTPWLLYWVGVSRMSRDLPESRAALEHAYWLFRSGDDLAGLCLSWSGIVDTFVFDWSDMKRLDFWIGEMTAILTTSPVFPSYEIEARVAAGMFCAMMYRQPDHPDLGSWEGRIVEAILRTTDMDLRLGMAGHLLVYYTWWVGGQQRAERIIEMMKSLELHDESSHLHYIAWHAGESAHLCLTNRLSECREALDKGLAMAERTDIHIWDFMLFSHMVRLDLCEDRVDEARGYLDRMAFILNTNRKLDISHYYGLHGLLALSMGNPSLALRHATLALKLGLEAGVPFVYSWYRTIIAEAMIELGRLGEAEAYLDEASEYGSRMENININYLCTLFRTLLSFKRNNDEEGYAFLRRYLVISKESGSLNHPGWRSSVMAPLLEKALEAGIETYHVRRLIKEHAIAPRDGARYISDWPWRVKVETLGGFRLTIDDEPLTFGRKVQKRPLALLKLIVAEGGRDTPQEALEDILWPEAEGDTATDAFKINLSRLRKLLGTEGAIEVHGGKVSLGEALVWTDIKALLRLAEEISRLWRSRRAEAVLEKAEEASRRLAAIYKGDFLKNDDETWIYPYRERTRGLYGISIRRLGDIFVESLREDLLDALHESAVDAGFSREEVDAVRRPRRF